jgi:hypothetical protein
MRKWRARIIKRRWWLGSLGALTILFCGFSYFFTVRAAWLPYFHMNSAGGSAKVLLRVDSAAPPSGFGQGRGVQVRLRDTPAFNWGLDALYDPPFLVLTFPWLPLFVAAGALMVLYREKKSPGLCKCGYDRAGLAAGSPCPECGSPAV